MPPVNFFPDPPLIEMFGESFFFPKQTPKRGPAIKTDFISPRRFPPKTARLFTIPRFFRCPSQPIKGAVFLQCFPLLQCLEIISQPVVRPALPPLLLCLGKARPPFFVGQPLEEGLEAPRLDQRHQKEFWIIHFLPALFIPRHRFIRAPEP